MNICRIQLSLVFVLIACIVKAQNSRLVGKIFDMESQPIPYANATLYSYTDSLYLNGAISNDNGEFVIENVKFGNYYLKLSFIGFESKVIDSVQVKLGTNNLGSFQLDILSENLEGVTVKASRQALSYKVDKKIIDAKSFPSANVAMDLLENIPSVQVDFEGKLTYRGDGTFKVYINGHPVANGEVKLRQISADKIDRIEVITNPSAKYDAEGTAGIIQVILKRNRLQGYAINSSAKASSIGSSEWLFNIDQKGQRGGWYIDGQLANFKWNKIAVNQTRNNVSSENSYITESKVNSLQGAFMNYIEFGFNYDLSDKDYIDFSVYTNPLKCTNENTDIGDFNDQTYNLTNEIVSDEYYELENNYSLFYRYIGATLTYEHAFNEDYTHMLKTYFDYSSYLHPFEEKQVDKLIYPEYINKLGFSGKEYNEMMFEANLGYENQINDISSFELGLEASLDHIPKVTSVSGEYDDSNILNPFLGEPINQEVDFKQDVYSAYAMFKSGFDKFEYQFGIRMEYTDRKSNYSFDNVNERIKIPAEKSFVDFFPSAHTLYNFDDDHQIGLNYSRRIERPGYWSLIPLSQYSTPYTYYKGNGNLKPSYANALEAVYKKAWNDNFIGLELFTRNTSNVEQHISRVDSLNILVETPENVGKSWANGFEVMSGYDIAEWWNTNVSWSLYTYQLYVTLDEQDKYEYQLRSDGRLNNTFSLPKDFKVKWDLNYKSPEIKAQYKREGYFYSNFAIQKSFLDNTWQLLLSCYNVLNSFKYQAISEGVNFKIVTDYEVEPVVSLKVSYSFDNQK